MADDVRIGLIGYGGMGSSHCEYLSKGVTRGAKLAAIADTGADRLAAARAKFGDAVKYFDTAEGLIASGEVDAVVIATPHYFHPPLGIKAMEAGLHVMSEKPAGVYTKQVKEMIKVAEGSDKVYGVMFNQRTRPAHQKLRELVQGGELGQLKRSMYVITDWLRTQVYYDAATWKGTWEGEGGAVLMNQSPHNLDLFQWICGMPKRVRSFCHMARYHNIETEDDVTTYVEYENGGTGTFITSTGEAPGSQFMEIHGERGKIAFADNNITFHQTRTPVNEHIRTSDGAFSKPETWKIEIPTHGKATEHQGIMQNWVDAIRNGTPLLAPGVEGIHGVALANAMLMSSWLDKTVELPIDDDVFYEMLQEKIRGSTFKKPETKAKAMDFAGTF
ncbi:MAG: Gfo/Idh/MocA family protein [Phycisphaerae bacterium]